MTHYTPIAKDINGAAIKVGDVCVFIGGGDGDYRDEYRGTRVVVRAIKAARLTSENTFKRGPRKGQPKPGWPNTTTQLRVDDAVRNPDEDHAFQWAAWVDQGDVAKVES